VINLKLWKGNRISCEQKVSNNIIVDGFLKSKFAQTDYLRHVGLDFALSLYVTSPEPDGLNSTWEWDSSKGGSIEGSPDMSKIREAIRKKLQITF
jgi:hypothetical protein